MLLRVLRVHARRVGCPFFGSKQSEPRAARTATPSRCTGMAGFWAGAYRAALAAPTGRRAEPPAEVVAGLLVLSRFEPQRRELAVRYRLGCSCATPRVRVFPTNPPPSNAPTATPTPRPHHQRHAPTPCRPRAGMRVHDRCPRRERGHPQRPCRAGNVALRSSRMCMRRGVAIETPGRPPPHKSRVHARRGRGHCGRGGPAGRMCSFSRAAVHRSQRSPPTARPKAEATRPEDPLFNFPTHYSARTPASQALARTPAP
ncbi:hypothetical protein Mycsm_00343 [Mycobacterium sp. JS623]|nr:hypothetical protein Mycsm_00343 [Mycobacterium sp. JS623]